MPEVKIKIDGQEVVTDSSKTILEVARSLGKDIPTLCHDPRLEPFTSCFVCVVEVEGARGFVPSCATRVTPDMVIRTDSPEIRSARKMALELMASNHFADCLGPCELTCPAGVDIQGYIALLAMGHYREAVALIKETNPLPSVCGRVCTRPCEGKCRRNLTGDPVGIDYLKRYAADLDRECGHPFTPSKKADTGRRVAIVGGGPAGLTAAWYLALEGHQVVIFEAHPKPGGWLMYGIPEYRLPEDVLMYEVDSILKLGVELKTGTVLGRDFTIEGLFDQGYEAVFLGVGAQKSTGMKIEGENAEGVMAGIEFLEQVNRGDITSLKGRAAVVGGGNTAVDAARTSLRLGASEVILVYRRSRSEMPAHHLEIEEMEKEGVKLELLCNPIRFNVGKKGRVKSMTCVRMELGEPDASGRRRPIPKEGSEFDIKIDWAFTAIGQQPDLAFLEGSRFATELKTSRWGTIETDLGTTLTNIPGVYAGGDAVTGAATAIEAIAAGKKAASAIHRQLTGQEISSLKKLFISRKDALKPQLTPEDLFQQPSGNRNVVPMLSAEERMKGFIEVELGYSAEQAAAEVQRCLECGCTAFFECDLQQHCTNFEITQGAFGGDFHNEQTDERHPFLRFDLNKCILCGRCVRICEEVVGAAALGFVRRGFDTNIRPAMEKPLLATTCISCGQCADTCPTGAITVKPDSPKPGPFKFQPVPSVCPFCSVGCGIKLEAAGDRLVRVSSNPEAPVNDGGNLCRNGRFGFRSAGGADRLTRPLRRIKGKLIESSWEEAYAFIKEKAGAIAKRHNPDAFAVVAGVRLTNEEAFLAQKLARLALKTPNVYSIAGYGQAAPEQFFTALPGTDYAQLRESSFILALGLNALEDYPVLDFKLQRAARSGKTEVYCLNSDGAFLARRAKRWLQLSPENVAAFSRALLSEALARFQPDSKLEGLADLKRHLDDVRPMDVFRKIGVPTADANVILERLVTGRSVVVFDLESVGPEAATYIYDLYVLMSSRGREIAVLPMVGRANSRGVLEMGCDPAFLPGWRAAADPAANAAISQLWGQPLPGRPGAAFPEFINGLHKGSVRGLFVFGDDLIGSSSRNGALAEVTRNLDLLVVQDIYLTRTAELAHVVLPMPAPAETDGTYINAERRLQRLAAVGPSPAAKNALDVLGQLSQALGQAIYAGNLNALWKEMEAAIPYLRKVNLADLGLAGVVLANGFTQKRLMVPSPTSRVEGLEFQYFSDIMLRRWKNLLREVL